MMKINEAADFLKSLLNKTNEKSEIKATKNLLVF